MYTPGTTTVWKYFTSAEPRRKGIIGLQILLNLDFEDLSVKNYCKHLLLIHFKKAVRATVNPKWNLISRIQWTTLLI